MEQIRQQIRGKRTTTVRKMCGMHQPKNHGVDVQTGQRKNKFSMYLFRNTNLQ